MPAPGRTPLDGDLPRGEHNRRPMPLVRVPVLACIVVVATSAIAEEKRREALRAQVPTWVFRTWRCDPAISGADGQALLQRRFSLTINKPGRQLKWSTMSTAGGAEHGDGK